MNLGFDIDDTISNTNEVLMEAAINYNKEHGNLPLLTTKTNDFSKVFGWNGDEVEKFFRTCYLDALKKLKPKPHVREVLTALRKKGHRIIFITIRNDRECAGENEARRITEEWFKQYGIPFDELHVAISDKKTFCQEHNIDVFMDDSEKHCRAVSELGIRTFIADNIFNQDFKDEKIKRIKSMDEYYEAIEGIEPEI